MEWNAFMPQLGCSDPIPRWRFLDACENGDVDCVTRYVETVDRSTYLQDDAALNSSVYYDHPEVLRILLEAGVDPNIHGEHVPALHVAAANDNVKAATILIEHGAEIDARDTANNDTALMYGIRDGKLNITEYLLRQGADPNLTDKNGLAPLHIATARNDVELVRCLLGNGTAVNARTAGHGRTALLIAAMSGFAEMVETLLKAGANPSLPDNVGKLPLERALEYHRSDVVRLLEKTSSR